MKRFSKEWFREWLSDVKKIALLLLFEVMPRMFIVTILLMSVQYFLILVEYTSFPFIYKVVFIVLLIWALKPICQLKNIKEMK